MTPDQSPGGTEPAADTQLDGNRDEQTDGPSDDGDPATGNAEIERSRRDVERLKGHSRSFDDVSGVNPDRSQQSRQPSGGGADTT